MVTREYLLQRIAEYEARLAAIDRFGEDDFEDGEVLRFDKKFDNSQIYTYAAVKAGGLWYTTGPKSNRGYSWDELVQFMSQGVDEVYWASELVRL